ncbi:pentapeptide repeat-containing protein [Streptomyces rhizosphaerihabitans]|uniref:pentapeptide repeat-containing protein n=1 Tax=Streptomyces rhizosphaerihabitans TaxID=1266770 RepID=UPI0021C07C0E|nr:pentapeptide repeat-containing protein [Streptomyces rhizosphaerihabitans]MCT9003471.1 pentapeptide repeat-containing protein [Streptomyces rhizosphaerihabitans]
MTFLGSLFDTVSLILAPAPSPSPLANQSAGSASPLWAILLVGLGGSLLGGAGVYFGARRSERSLRKSAQESLQHERTRLLNERFATAAELLGHDEAACRLAGVHALAGLADDWTERRQTCIDVLCAYLRMPYPPKPDETAFPEQHLAWQANREVRHTVIRIICNHLRVEGTLSTASWDGYDYDFTGAVFDGGDFSNTRFRGAVNFSAATFTDDVNFFDVEFTGGEVSFDRAVFSGAASFDFAKFAGGKVSFDRAVFTDSVRFGSASFAGGKVSFRSARFTNGPLSFFDAEFTSGKMSFDGAVFTNGSLSFLGAKFIGGEVSFRSTKFHGGEVTFQDAKFTGSKVTFQGAEFANSGVIFGADFIDGEVSFDRAVFSGAASFDFAKFAGGKVSFDGAVFRRGWVGFLDGRESKFLEGAVTFFLAEFTGSDVTFHQAEFVGSQVDIQRVASWTVPPIFDSGVVANPPEGLLLPPSDTTGESAGSPP